MEDHPQSFPLRSVVLALIWLLVFVSALGLAGWFYLDQIYYSRALDSSVELPTSVEFQIEQGEGIAAITARLEKLGVVQDDWVLGKYLKREGLDRQVEAGYFNFSGTLTVPQVAKQLLRGGTQQIKFTILEGWNSAEIDAALVKEGLIQSNDYKLFVRDSSTLPRQARDWSPPEWVGDKSVTSLEGYLFPATYFLDLDNFSVENLVQRQLSLMKSKLKQAGYDPARSKRSLHQILTIASIVELEERDPLTRPLVADILWRRLDAGWQLGADATLFYQLGHRESLTTEDLAIDSPYNTRKNRGLPPTPVASPGLSALTAAVSPQANEYWYYLHDRDGKVHFSKTLDEHNQQRIKYLK